MGKFIGKTGSIALASLAGAAALLWSPAASAERAYVAQPQVVVVHAPQRVWIPAHWEQRGHARVWVDGYWAQAAHPSHGHRQDQRRWERQARWDQDRDGIPNSRDRDRDGDGVPNRWDRQPANPYRR
jgi:hypothetical protein